MNEEEIAQEINHMEMAFEVTDLTKSHPNHIRKGTFARMINFVDPKRQEERRTRLKPLDKSLVDDQI